MSNPNQRRKQQDHAAVMRKIARMIREAQKVKRTYERRGQLDLFEHTKYAEYLRIYENKEHKN